MRLLLSAAVVTASSMFASTLHAQSGTVRGTVLGDIYAGNVFDHAQGKWWYEMTNAQRLSAMTSEGNLVFAGSHVSADASRALNAYKSLYVTAPASLAGQHRTAVCVRSCASEAPAARHRVP